MLTKATAHFRPFIRLPSHSGASPDHFTANPSLLHHLPHNGAGNSLVAQTQSSTQTAGGSGSAGRHGYGGNAGAGGGYTGHARAFLSLPQTASVDPSSTLSNSDDNQLQNASSPQGANLLLKHRLSKRTRIVGPIDGTGREVRREIEARASGNKVKVLEIDGGEEADWKEEKLALPAGRGRRRSSIAFPSQAGSSSRTSASEAESSRAPTRPRAALHRSQTTLEILQVGIPRSRAQQLGLRSISTQADIPRIAQDEPLVTASSTRATRILSQPNRVLMDLAGRDLPGKRLGSVRRNSTAAVERTSLDVPPVELLSQQSTPQTHKPVDPRDHAIDGAMRAAWEAEDAVLAEQLVRHYRSPRSVSPFAEDQVAGDPALTSQYPLPEGYTIRTYNTCLSLLLHFRTAGQSIAPILEMYNEILERDLIPNSPTYSAVIRALALRSIEVSSAVTSWEDQKKWGLWRAELVGKESWNAELAAERDQTLASYQAENNLSSALKLFRAAYMTNAAAGFHIALYGTLLHAMSKQSPPDVTAILQVKQIARKFSVPGRLSLYQWVFKGMGAAKNREELDLAWKQFVDRAETPSGEQDWLAALPGGKRLDDPQTAKRVEGLRLETWESAMLAFIEAGNTAKGIDIFKGMVKSVKSDEDKSVDYTKAPAATHRTCGELVAALAQAGHLDLAVEWVDKIHSPDIIEKMPIKRLTLEHTSRVVDSLILVGRNTEAIQFLKQLIGHYDEFTTQASRSTIGRRLWRLYTALVSEAARVPSSERGPILDQVRELGSLGRIPLDTQAIAVHFALLTEAGRHDELAHTLDMCQPAKSSRPEITAPLVNALKQAAGTAIPLKPLLAALASADRHSVRIDAGIAEAVVGRYFNGGKRTAVEELGLTPASWFSLIQYFAALPSSNFSEGEFDDVFIRLFEDLAVANKEHNQFVSQLASNVVFRPVVRTLVYRVGVERSTQLLTPIFGEEVSQQMTAPAPAESASATATSSSPSDADDQSTLPSSPGSVFSSPESQLHIDRSLSQAVERFTHRNPAITPLDAYELVRKGLARHAVPFPNVLCSLIDHLARAGDEPKVRELYALAQRVLSTITRPENQAQYWRQVEDAMLIACCHLGYLEQAGMHRARIVEAGMAPSADAYASMIASSKDTTDDALVARELFDESQAMGVTPHLYLYNTIISKLSKARKAETALELFNHMKTAGIRPSSVTYGAVINACCRVGDAQSAETLFEEMASQPNFRARVPPFNTMMQFYLQTQPNRERVMYYYNALQAAQVPPSAHTYKLLLDTYATLAPIDLEAMENVFSELKANRKVPVQGTHYACLINAYGLYGNDLAKAKEVFERIPSKDAKEAVVWEAMLNVLSQRGTLDELESTREKMTSSGVQPTAYVYNALINGYSRAHEIAKARELFESMGDSITGVAAPNNHPTLLTSSGHVKPNTITTEPTRVVFKEPSTYEAMIRAEVRAGERTKAEDVLKRMEERGYPVAVFMRGRAALDEITA